MRPVGLFIFWWTENRLDTSGGMRRSDWMEMDERGKKAFLPQPPSQGLSVSRRGEIRDPGNEIVPSKAVPEC